MREDKDVQKRRHNVSYRNLVLAWLTKVAAHFRIELSDEEQEIFLDNLPTWSDYQIETAFSRVITECMFFPKLREVLDRMPERRQGRSRLCARCQPDGWVVIPSPTNPGYNVAVRCDHVTDYPPRHDSKALFEKLDKMFTQPSPKPRFPHLASKGILYEPPQK